jgi:hypothetical protein
MLVRRITASDDKDLAQMCALHDRLFPEEVRDSSQDVVRWLAELEVERREGRNKLEDYLLIAKLGSVVVGYLYAQYYLDAMYLFISYYGIDKQYAAARKTAASSLLSNLVTLVRRNHSGCKGLVSELERGKATALRILYRRSAKAQGLKAYEICFQYEQPALSPAKELSTVPQVLVYVPTDAHAGAACLTRAGALGILRCILLEVYGDSYEHDAEMDCKYRKYLRRLYERYEQTLPETIPLKPLGNRGICSEKPNESIQRTAGKTRAADAGR